MTTASCTSYRLRGMISDSYTVARTRGSCCAFDKAVCRLTLCLQYF